MDSTAHRDTTPPLADTKTAVPPVKVETVRVAVRPPAPLARPSPPSAPTSAPPAAPPTSPPAPADTTANNWVPGSGGNDAVRANAEVQRAAQMIVNEHPDMAMALLRKAMPYLATKQDSVTAWYHMSEALLQRADKRDDSAAKTRACDILDRIRKDKRHPDASGISSLYDLTCK